MMLSKNQIKYIRQLKNPKYRNLHGEFIAEGPKVVSELLQSRIKVKAIFALPEWIALNSAWADLCVVITSKELSQISTLKTPNQVLCIAEIYRPAIKQLNTSGNLTLILDGINDPGNMGTIIRTADWFGINTIICSPDCVDIYNPKVVQASMGSITRIQVCYTILSEFLAVIPFTTKVYGAYLNGDNLYAEKMPSESYLVIGSESHGISAETGQFINHRITIPAIQQSGAKGAESLNASVAAAIFCSEYRRNNS